MPITDDIMARARRSNPAAVESILSDAYPAVHRMVYALTGDSGLAERVIRQVLRDAVRVMPRWRRGITPENWFYHRALLTARQLADRPVSPARDPLMPAEANLNPAYAAFIRALRQLPRQQMEAFVLNQGEHFNSRLLGVTMDCSADAAAVHLQAATQTLETLTGTSLSPWVTAFERAYHALSPPPTLVQAQVVRQARTALWLIRLRRLLRRIITLAILAALAWAGWHWRAVLLHWFEIRTGESITDVGTSPSPGTPGEGWGGGWLRKRSCG
jgi:DNA-directed RNA polymerase specialized sigma24 family protein